MRASLSYLGIKEKGIMIDDGIILVKKMNGFLSIFSVISFRVSAYCLLYVLEYK